VTCKAIFGTGLGPDSQFALPGPQRNIRSNFMKAIQGYHLIKPEGHANPSQFAQLFRRGTGLAPSD